MAAFPGVMGKLTAMAMAGDPQGGAEHGATPEQVSQVSGDNPQELSPADQYFSVQGVSEADQKQLTDIIQEYRESWAQDRLERLRQWMENVFYWKGLQVIRWDSSSNCWYDALGWARSEGQEDGEETELERWINPLTLMFANVFTGTMSRAVPRCVIKPQNADASLKDTITAKAGKEALGIIERKNRIKKMVRSEFEMLYLFGSYFKYTRAVVDGNMFGWDTEAVFADMEIEMPARYKCPKCGTETPAAGGQMDGIACPECGAFLGQESYFAAGEGNRKSLKAVGEKKVPRAGVKMSLHSPLEIDCDPKAKGDRPLEQTPILNKELEIDFGEACRMFPALRGKIAPGVESSTTENAGVEKLARTDAVSAMGGYTADNTMGNPTFSQTWVTPNAYYKKGDYEFGARMEKKFSEGLVITQFGPLVADIRAANLIKEWSHCALYENQGIYCQAIANTVVSFNARFNRVMWILDDWAARASVGLNFFDAARVDTEKMSGKRTPAGTGIPVPMRVHGEARPMSEIMAHFDLPINPALWNYPQMLLTFCELIVGIPRQLGGTGTQDDVETLGGQQLQLSRAATTLKPYWENVQDEHAHASFNAIYCLKALMRTGSVKKIWDVIEARGGAFQNNEVDWTAMEGDVEVVVDEDQDLPVSPEELRAAFMAMFEALKENNPAAAEWFAVPENQDMVLSSMVPGSALPSEPQRLKTEMDIQTLIENPSVMVMDPRQAGAQVEKLPVEPDKNVDDFAEAKEVIRRYRQSHCELRTQNPMAWARLDSYYDMLVDLEAQVAAEQAKRQMMVQAAGVPPKQDSTDPEMKAEMQELMQQAGPAIMRLAQIMSMDPVLTKGTASAQVSAAKEIVDTTVDAARLMAGGK
jgi:hypothetical protein